MGFFSFLSVLSTTQISAFTAMKRGTKVGQDAFGNTYFKAAPRKGYKRERRWVMYKESPEATTVPAEWHGWLHHQTDVMPDPHTDSYRRPWQKPHQPNMTGTNKAYRPKGHILEGGKRDRASGDYEPWTPPQ